MKLSGGILAALAALVLGACSEETDGPRQTVEFWVMGSEGLAVGPLIEEFEAENPGIEVELQQIAVRVAHERFLTAFAGDATPDLAQLGNTWIPELTELDALRPLDDFVARSETVDPEDYFEGIWQASLADGGEAMGIPWYVDTRLLFYHAGLLAGAGYETPPQSWADWRAAMEAVRANGKPGDYPALLPLNEYEPFVALALQQDADLLREDGRFGNFADPELVAMLDFYLGLFRDGLAIKATNTQISNVYHEINRGRFAFYITGPWNIGEFSRRLPEDRQHIWATAPLPGPDGPGLSSAGGSSLVIFERSQHPEAAWRLAEFLSRPENQRRFYDLVGDLPPRRSAWEDARFDDPRVDAFRQQMERLEPSPRVPEWERIATEIRLVIEQAVYANWSAERTAHELDIRINEILDKRRWMLDRTAERAGEDAAP